ncbi:hypothetical protein NL676_014773 [Syzygium grande]|nr:hypothetical protein NL676_014773 [Syzygium grande]
MNPRQLFIAPASPCNTSMNLVQLHPRQEPSQLHGCQIELHGCPHLTVSMAIPIQISIANSMIVNLSSRCSHGAPSRLSHAQDGGTSDLVVKQLRGCHHGQPQPHCSMAVRISGKLYDCRVELLPMQSTVVAHSSIRGPLIVPPPTSSMDFVHHGCVVSKVYVVGEYVQYVKCRSLPNVSEKLEYLVGLVSFSQVSNSVIREDGDDSRELQATSDLWLSESRDTLTMMSN